MLFQHIIGSLKLLVRDYTFFCILSLKSGVYFTLTAHFTA